ncbi:MAG: OmpA family protein [Flavobacteriales bacterium]|nr:OmpA family protein [Flavobacteriales bacterium]
MSRKTLVGKYLSKPTNSWIYRNSTSVVKYSIAFLILCCTTAQAQDYTSTDSKAIKAYESAMSAFDLRNHDLALSYTDEALDRDVDFIEPHLLRFEIYSELQDVENAEKALEAAIDINPDYYRNAYFFLGMLEMQQGKYAEAQPHFEQFKTYPNLNDDMVERSNREILNCEFALEALQNPVPFEPVNMGKAINSDRPEYYPSITADEGTFIFTRLVKDGRSYQGKNEEILRSFLREDTWFPAVPIPELNSEFNEGAPSISGDGKTLVFTACELMGEYGGNRKGQGSCDLFISKNVAGKWTEPKNIGKPINTKYWETQPSLTADGNTVFFIRGVPSKTGVKEQDIYYSTKRPNGNWGIPVKLSSKINTPAREESVFIHPDGNTLYFSSEGHPGMGALDLYMSKRDEGGRWQDPVNLGYPINTHKDENSLLVSPNGDLAYFASDREGGFGDLDLYSFPLYEDARPLPINYAKGRVRDAETKEPLKAEFVLNDFVNQRLRLAFESDSITGEFIVAIPADKRYALNVKADGYLPHSETFRLEKSGKGEGYDVDIELEKIAKDKKIVLENLFFDVDKDVIKRESQAELNELAEFFESHPDMRIEIGGHTDNQGDKEYNLDLSKRRAIAVKRFFTDREYVDEDRIETKGYGDSQPIDTNETITGRANNRRTEIKIISLR